MAKFCNKCGAPLIPGQPHICPAEQSAPQSPPPHRRPRPRRLRRSGRRPQSQRFGGQTPAPIPPASAARPAAPIRRLRRPDRRPQSAGRPGGPNPAGFGGQTGPIPVSATGPNPPASAVRPHPAGFGGPWSQSQWLWRPACRGGQQPQCSSPPV